MQIKPETGIYLCRRVAKEEHSEGKNELAALGKYKDKSTEYRATVQTLF